jgi:hypothetical protein
MDTKAEVQEIAAAVTSEPERPEVETAKPTVPWPTWAITEGHLMAEVWADGSDVWKDA